MREVKTWDQYWIDMALLVSSRSKDPSTQVGTVLVDEDQTLLASGYNGFPPGYPDTQEHWDNRELKYARVIHAECNAVGRAARKGVKTLGATAYVTHFPCSSCAKVLAAAGIKKVIYSGFVVSQSSDEWDHSRSLMEASGIKVEKLNG